jgi:hypothetical protein
VNGWLGDAAIAHLRDVAEWPDVGERYELTRRLGRGGMGTVYAARDRVLDREVAIKVLDDVGSGADAAHLLAEARVLGRLEHPGIVPVHDAGALADGRVFYVMKLVRGDRLDAALASRTLSERLDLFLRICDAVSFAHAHGIVHRDLKPQNVMLGPFGEVLVMDWGVAKVPGGAADAAVVVGTPGYMAPGAGARCAERRCPGRHLRPGRHSRGDAAGTRAEGTECHCAPCARPAGRAAVRNRAGAGARRDTLQGRRAG